MRLGIDASNIRFGGGITHLTELLNAAEPQAFGFDRVIVWSNSGTLDRLTERAWLTKAHDPLLERALPLRFNWQRFTLKRYLLEEECDILFVPGGAYLGNFSPFVTMSQNMLPFEWAESRRFGMSWMRVKMTLLRHLQIHTFKKADGLIFLTKYAQDVITNTARKIHDKGTVIPHGVNDRFPLAPRAQRPIQSYSEENPIKILYVSTVDVFKHQRHVAEAVTRLKTDQLSVHLDLVGAAYPPSLDLLLRELHRIDPAGRSIHYHGPVSYSEVYRHYHDADIFVFASSCENLPNILIEAMAAGLPIACSNRGPMPEVLGNAGVYFDPEKPAEITEALRKLIKDPILRAEKAESAYQSAKKFTWDRCAKDTLGFLAHVARRSGGRI